MNISDFDVKSDINHSNHMLKIYSSIDEYYKEHSNDNYVFYTMANSPIIDLLINFVKSAQLNNLSPVIFALDHQIIDKLDNYDVIIIKWSDQFDRIQTQDNMDTFKHMMFNKFKITHALLNYFKTLIYSDIDVYINSNVVDIIELISKDTIHEIYIQSNLNNCCCTGFYVVKSNSNTKTYLILMNQIS